MELFDKACVISADGNTVLPVDGSVVAVLENGRISYYDLTGVIENAVVSCGRFMLDQSIVEEPPHAVRGAAESSL